MGFVVFIATSKLIHCHTNSTTRYSVLLTNPSKDKCILPFTQIKCAHFHQWKLNWFFQHRNIWNSSQKHRKYTQKKVEYIYELENFSICLCAERMNWKTRHSQRFIHLSFINHFFSSLLFIGKLRSCLILLVLRICESNVWFHYRNGVNQIAFKCLFLWHFVWLSEWMKWINLIFWFKLIGFCAFKSVCAHTICWN